MSILYVEDRTALLAQLPKICSIIDALYDVQINGADSLDVKKHSLDDSQVKIVKEKNTPAEIASAITKYEKLKQTTLNKLNGRGMALRDQRGLK